MLAKIDSIHAQKVTDAVKLLAIEERKKGYDKFISFEKVF